MYADNSVKTSVQKVWNVWLIKKGCFGDATAVFCTTIHAAIAFIRACKNNGLNPENGYAVFTIDDEGIGMHSTPSVGCFHKPDIQKMLRPVFKWIREGGRSMDWNGLFLIEPSGLQIHEGETVHSPESIAALHRNPDSQYGSFNSHLWVVFFT